MACAPLYMSTALLSPVYAHIEPKDESLMLGHTLKLAEEIDLPANLAAPFIHDFTLRLPPTAHYIGDITQTCHKLRATVYYYAAQAIYTHMIPDEREACGAIGDALAAAHLEVPVILRQVLEASILQTTAYFHVIPHRPLRFRRWVLMGLHEDLDCPHRYPDAHRTVWRDVVSKHYINDLVSQKETAIRADLHEYQGIQEGRKSLETRGIVAFNQDDRQWLKSSIAQLRTELAALAALRLVSDLDWIAGSLLFRYGPRLGTAVTLVNARLIAHHIHDDQLVQDLYSVMGSYGYVYQVLLGQAYPLDSSP
ncbi:hypothetical protein IWQ60_003891 [Tieghemiomyces parasiticus]|uniref:Uncharacterized protein n=1 Tax=Tieghemiomyces parasiticus TaxID=78921 RepID=A0A9W8E0A3_9FUNG|nr:hypothetical protein IWQ60_003891 [Tieghemiomyces parasiticus]